MKKLIILIIFFILVSTPGWAKTLYVNNTGSATCSDATTYANNSASAPWCTIGRAAWGSTTYVSPNAAQAAQAGDTVLITAGTYNTSGATSLTGRWNVALNPTNSGTVGNLITFRGVGTVYIRMNSGYYGPMIGADSRNYIVWDNFYIDDYYSGSVGDTGPVVFHASTGSQLINSKVKGHPGSYYNGQATFTDNYNGIRIEATNGVIIKNNEIFGVTTGGHNQAGIMLYDAANTIMEHNYIHGNNCGIFVKGDHAGDGWPQENNIIRYNWIEGNLIEGINLYYAVNGTQVYQNIIKGNVDNLSTDAASTGNGSNVTIQNNTIISTNQSGDVGIGYGGTSTSMVNWRVFNNIFYGSFYEAVNAGGMSAFGDQQFEHNVYYGFDTFGSLNGTQISFATWRASYGKDHVTPDGLNSNPLFVNETLYKLQAGSPAIALGVDILNLAGGGTSAIIPAGAYISGNEVIGLLPGELPSAPSPPVNPRLLY
jgi:hypothetical protein